MIIRVTTWLVDNIYFGAMYFLLRKIVTYKNVLILANNLENCYPDYDLFKENIAIFGIGGFREGERSYWRGSCSW